MSTIPFTTTNNKTITFTKSFNQVHTNLKFISRIRAQADSMFLENEARVLCGVVTVTVHCDTEFEHSQLEKLFRGL